jgi:hypothetical protein
MRSRAAEAKLGRDASRSQVMSNQSAGILLYRVRASGAEVYLVHFGGPFWARKDRGAW